MELWSNRVAEALKSHTFSLLKKWNPFQRSNDLNSYVEYLCIKIIYKNQTYGRMFSRNHFVYLLHIVEQITEHLKYAVSYILRKQLTGLY